MRHSAALCPIADLIPSSLPHRQYPQGSLLACDPLQGRGTTRHRRVPSDVSGILGPAHHSRPQSVPDAVRSRWDEIRAAARANGDAACHVADATPCRRPLRRDAESTHSIQHKIPASLAGEKSAGLNLDSALCAQRTGQERNDECSLTTLHDGAIVIAHAHARGGSPRASRQPAARSVSHHWIDGAPYASRARRCIPRRKGGHMPRPRDSPRAPATRYDGKDAYGGDPPGPTRRHRPRGLATPSPLMAPA